MGSEDVLIEIHLRELHFIDINQHRLSRLHGEHLLRSLRVRPLYSLASRAHLPSAQAQVPEFHSIS
jgi:hypothetical protein